LHIRCVMGIMFYAIIFTRYVLESNAVIPVNLKIGYESTVLFWGETRENPSVYFPRKPPRTYSLEQSGMVISDLLALN
jgi:hypothetical protein